MQKTNVSFYTENKQLLYIYNLAEKKALENICSFGSRKVLIEGGVYQGVWLETQPMGGEMYAKRNLEVGLNNQLIFMENQREDGRLPGIIRKTESGLEPGYGHLQGYCFPYHAVNMYYLARQKKDYLEYLYTVLEKFDEHLWKERGNNDKDFLELWCVWDTGEDNCQRLKGAPHEWNKGSRPEGFDKIPFYSMDIMGYSYEGRSALAEISSILNNGQQEYWKVKASQVRSKMKDFLWRDDKGAFFDRDCNSEFMDCLYQGNIKALYFKCMDGYMANRFIDEHLLNPQEFFTAMPLPSVAVNDECFENVSINNWSGQVQSLTYQRSIRAMENYGRYYEITTFAHKYLSAVQRNGFFPQQFDPFTGIAFSGGHQNRDYGPSILTTLEFIARLYGVNINRNDVYFGCCGGAGEREYIQNWLEHEYVTKYDGKNIYGFADGRQIFKVTPDVWVVTDYCGNIKRLINVSSADNTVVLNGRQITLKKNEVIALD